MSGQEEFGGKQRAQEQKRREAIGCRPFCPVIGMSPHLPVPAMENLSLLSGKSLTHQLISFLLK